MDKILKQNEFQELKFEFIASKDSYCENLIIFFHGLGDNAKNYIKLGERLNLPQTSILSVQAPYKLPFCFDNEDMYMWWDSFDLNDGSEKNITHEDLSYNKSITRLNKLLDYTLSKGYKSEHTFLFGFSQGATIAVGLCLTYPFLLGGTIGIAGLPLDSLVNKLLLKDNIITYETRIMFIIGDKDEKYPIQKCTIQIDKIKQLLPKRYGEGIQLSIIKGKGHEMSHIKEEVKIWMQFISKNLRLRNPQLESMADEIIEIKKL